MWVHERFDGHFYIIVSAINQIFHINLLIVCHFAKEIFKTRFWSARSFTNWCCCLTILSTVGDHVSIIRGRESSTVDKMVSIVQMYIVVHTTSEFSSISSTRRRITTTGFFFVELLFCRFLILYLLKKS